MGLELLPRGRDARAVCHWRPHPAAPPDCPHPAASVPPTPNPPDAPARRPGGTVWAGGANSEGELGTGTTTNQTLPVQVPGLAGITQVAAGGDTSFAVRSAGTLFAWGSNAWGLLGNGSDSGQSATPAADWPEEIGRAHV